MPSTAQQIRFCTSRDGTRIAYEICGSGPPLVWAAFWGHHIELDWKSPVWGPWLVRLASRHRLVRYDWRGCGLSDRKQVEFSFEKNFEDLSAVIGAAQVNRFSLFGMANGGALSMAYAARYPEQVEHLILYGTQLRGRRSRGITPDQIEEAETRLKMIKFGWQNENAAFGQFFSSLHMPDASAPQGRSLSDLIRATTSPENAVNILRTFFQFEISDIASGISCPTLVLHARGDAAIPFEEGRAVAATIPGARFVPLESRNHVLLDTEPAWSHLFAEVDGFVPTHGARNGPTQFLSSLTPREREVIRALSLGLDNKSIASRLGLSEKTVRNNVSILFSKLGCNSRAHAVAMARDAGIGPLDGIT